MGKKTQAIRDGMMLTVGFHTADPPLVWRFDVAGNPTFSLALQARENGWDFGFVAPKTEFSPVAHFAMRAHAEEALIAVERALEDRKIGTLIGKGLLFAGAAAVIILLLALTYGTFAASRSTPVANAATTLQNGVPFAADDVLKPPN